MKIFFVSLGCDKNLVDSEVMLGLVKEQGYQIIDSEEEADIIVINSCCFINDAKEESINTILEMAENKKTGNCKALIVTGCLPERYRDEVMEEIPEIDAMLGTSSYDEIINAIQKALEGNSFVSYKDYSDTPITSSKRVLTSGGYYAYVKIAEGCDNRCTYCVIPKIRGKYRSRKMEDIIEEVKSLSQQGIKEIILVAQDTTLYGTDLYKEYKLPNLLEELSKIEEINWIRLLYCYPEEIKKEMLEVMRDNDKICNYLDIPIQHISNDILKKMGRRTTKETIIEKINLMKEIVPNIALRTTIITGFPGETNEQHQEVIEFIKEIKFDRLGVFTYSQEEDTPAAKLPDQVDEEIKNMRKDQIMFEQQEISKEISEGMIGKELEVIVEGYLPEEQIYIGRCYKDAPNVDGYVFFSANREIISGEFVKVNVTQAKEYDLIGEMKDEYC